MERLATIHGRTVRYLDAGRGTPVVLVHAFPLGADMWRAQLAAPPEGCRLVAPDLRGFGGSSRTAGRDRLQPARSVDDHARDVLALADALGLDRFALGGLSMGGYVAFAILRLAAGRVTGLLLADTRAEADTDEGRANRRQMLASLESSGVAAVADAMIPKLLGPSTRRDQPALEAFVRGMIERADAGAVADAIHCLLSRPDSTPLLETIRVPTRLVVGRDDELTPVALHERMRDRIPGAGLTVIERAGHLSNLEAPDVFTRALAQVVTSVS